MAALKFDKQFLQCFWDLAAVEEDVRSKAVATLIHGISHEEEKPSNDESGSESSSSEAADPKAARLAYSLRRLVGGLASSRDAARQGFAVALTALLKTYKEDVPIQEVWAKIDSLLNLEGASKQEERDVLFGRLFAMMALVRSERLYTQEGLESFSLQAEQAGARDGEESSSDDSDDSDSEEASGETDDSSAEDSSEEESSDEISKVQSLASAKATNGDVQETKTSAPFLVECVREVLAVAERKIYLREIAFSIVRTILAEAPTASITSLVLPELQKQLDIPLAELSPDQLGLVLVLQQRGIWVHKSGPLPSASTVRTLGSILASSTHAHPRVHSVWETVLPMLLEADVEPESEATEKGSEKSAPKKARARDSCALLLHFWLSVVDELLFNSDSPNRKYLAFQLVSAIVGQLDSEQITLVFTPNFLRCLITHLADRSTQLHAAAKATLRAILKAADEKEELRMPIALQLLSTERGTISFDQRTKTKAVATLLGGMDAAEASTFVEYLVGIFVNAAELHGRADEEGAERFVDSRRVWALNQMLALAKNSQLEKREEWLNILLKFLIKYGLFKPSSKVEKKKKVKSTAVISISDNVRSVCKQRLTTVLGLLDNLPSLSKSTKRRGITTSGQLWVTVATDYYSLLAKDHTPVVTMSDVQKKLFKKAKVAAEALNPEKSSSIVTMRALEYLLLQLSLLLVTEPEDDDIVQASEDVLECAARLSKKAKKKKASKQAEDEDVEDPFMVLVDVLMSLLSRSSAWTKNMVSRAFQGICSELTQEHLTPIFGIIAQAGNEDPEEEQSGNDSDDEEMAEAEEESEEESSEEESIDAKEVDVGMRDGDGDGGDIDLEDADPEQLQELDDRLTAMFKDMKARKAEQREFQQSAVTLRLRAIELLDVFSKRVRSPVLLSLFRPLYLCIRTTDGVEPQQPVYSKALALFKRMCKGKAPSTASLDGSKASAEYKQIYGQLEDFTQEVITRGKHLKGLKKPSKPSLEAAQDAIFFFTKAILHAAEALPVKHKNVLPNMAAYMQLMDKLVSDYAQSKKSIISEGYLEDFTRRFPSLSWKLALVFLFQVVQRGRNEFIKQSGCSILASILQQHASAKTESDTTLASSIAPKASAAFLEALKNADSTKRRVSILQSIKTAVVALKQLEALGGWNTDTYTTALQDLVKGGCDSQRMISLSNDVLIRLGANPLTVLAKRGRSDGPPAKKKKLSAPADGKAKKGGKAKKAGRKKSKKKTNTKS